jgi:SAM-dependent methyltransferase
MTDSQDYHDYFIKDGVHIGQYEEMYQNVDDPWHIDALGRRLDMEAALTLIRYQHRRFDRVLDLGCGAGFFSNLLRETVGGRIWASDVSATAVRKARRRYPGIDFFVLDLRQAQDLEFDDHSFDLIVMAQTLWCVIDRLENVLALFSRYLAPDGVLLISQHFLQPGTQSYGAEIVATPPDLIWRLERAGFEVRDMLETNRLTNHHVALAAGFAPPEEDGS